MHKATLVDVLTFAQENGFGVRGLLRNPVLGPKGNVEFLAWMELDRGSANVQALVDQVLGD